MNAHHPTTHAPRLAVFLLGLVVSGGCMRDRPAGRSVSDAWETPQSPSSGGALDQEPSPDEGGSFDTGVGPLPIATVNGKPITRDRLLNLLIESHGLSVLGQLIALEVTRQAAEAKGISITPDNIRAEYDKTLEQISTPVRTASQPTLDKGARERILNRMLARRGLSLEEFNLAMERNAYLRKLAETQIKVDERALREHYEKMYGERVQIRHIQLNDWRDVAKVKRLLDAGTDFAEAARVHSQNVMTASDGGLLPPFSKDQDDVPPLLREAAFALQLGQVSSPLKIDSEYHMIMPVKRFPKSNVKFEHVKEVVRMKLIDQLLPEVMDQLEKELVEQARKRIVITHPGLRKQFEERSILGRRGRLAPAGP